MFSKTAIRTLFSTRRSIVQTGRQFSTKINPHIQLSEEVLWALNENKPLVALESTIITHGMPYPDNVKCAMDVEEVVRRQGGIPATIAIVDGVVKVGLLENEINYLGDTQHSMPVKTSRRDLSYVISNKLNGGTTVSGTLVVVNKVGIPIFATGGIGGVHRGAEHTFDISADLIELGKSNVAVVSSGVKSILDIAKTLEFLETQGVFVATFGENNQFPAFYTRTSGCQVPYYIDSAMKAARLIKCNKEMNMGSGMLLAAPIPTEYALPEETINLAIEKALAGIDNRTQGKNITPSLLSEVAKITKGESLRSNVALIKNNAKVAAEIAVALQSLLTGDGIREEQRTDKPTNRPVIIGGSILDCTAKLDTNDIKQISLWGYWRFSHCCWSALSSYSGCRTLPAK